MKTVNRKVGYLILIVGLVACSAKSVKNSEEKDTDSVSIEVPSFDTDSAYAYIERQVQFGFRVPNTPAHLATADYLSSELARHGAVVEVQQGTVTAYDGTELSIRNIIGSFSPEKKNRILLFAHWDSRPYADNDPDKSKHRQPIAGADDGASGVGVLLEIARQIGKRHTALSQTLSFCILLSMFLRGKTVSQFRITAVTHSPAEFGTILMTGMPSFGRQGLNSIGGMLLNIAARGYGDAAVAGMSIVSRIFMFILSVAIGTGQGFQPVAGFNYGAQKYRRVQQACLFTMAASFCFLSVILTVCWFNAETLIRLFRDDPEVTAVALPAFRYQCFAMLLQPVIVAGNMLFQSIGKSGRATFLACCRQGVFFIPLILTLPRAFGLLGVEICQPIADVLTFFVTVPFLFPFLRQLVRMDEAEAAEV